ncbi:MAG: sensor histidine kinase [Microbacteriaceae bacterium]
MITEEEMMTVPTVSPQPIGHPYVRFWKRFPRDLGYLAFLGLLLATVYVALQGVFWAGVSTIAVGVGLFLILGSLFGARWLGVFELDRLAWAEPRAIARIEWPEGTGNNSFTRIFSALGNPRYWLYLVHAIVLLPILGLITVVFTVTWIFTAVTLVLAPAITAIVWLFSQDRTEIDNAVQTSPVDPVLGSILVFLLGVFFLALTPFITRGSVFLHFQLNRLVLGAGRVNALERQLDDLSASRGAAISAEGHSLRRLERDIHDGPQQRLVRLQMDLSAAERQLDTDPARARVLIAEAMAQSKEALEELRSLSRGFAPPILLDRGLVAALDSAAVRSAVPTRIVSAVPEGLALPLEVERNAYFVASEAMTNAVKHSGATEIETFITLRQGKNHTDWLDIVVHDNGSGGARSIAGHGIAGLQQRLQAFDGTFSVDSPDGGPTVIAASFPLSAETASDNSGS